MTEPSRIIKPGTDEIPQDIQDLGAAIAALPAEHRLRVEPIYRRVAESTKRRRRILSLVQEALGQLRLDMKYLMFDLEATRRERDEFQKQIQGESPDADPGESDQPESD